MKKFKAVMFDFDGTVTLKGQYHPTERIILKIHEIAKHTPIAFCTGRQLDSFLQHGMEFLFATLKEIQNSKTTSQNNSKIFNKSEFLKNFHLISENGSIGYYFDLEKDQFQEFYREDWPEKQIPKQKLSELIADAIAEIGSIFDNAHEVALVMRTNLHHSKNKVNEIYQSAEKIYQIAKRILEDNFPNYQNYLHLGNSGIGVIICPAKGNKDRGIQEFGKYLQKNRKLPIPHPFREILVVGDRPQAEGNDHYFLRGEFGTPFSVGQFSKSPENPEYPDPVLNEKNQKLLHEEGTFYLLEKFF